MENLISELKSFESVIKNLKSKDIKNLDLTKTMLFIVDMNNGFARNGALYSPRVESLINPITKFAAFLSSQGCNIIAFTDSHTPESIELQSYPTHCLHNNIESEVVSEIKTIDNIEIIPKNSTNGFFALDNFDFSNIDNIIITGDCTDICIYQLAVTLKAHFNHFNLIKDILVPVNLVDTYDIPGVHSADLMNLVFLNSMIQNGVTVVKNIIY